MSKLGALGSLKLSLNVSDQYGRDASQGIGVTDTYDDVSIGINSETNRYEKTSENVQSPVKKDVNARSDELEFYENQLAELKLVTEVADRKLFNAIESINEKKIGIVSITEEAIGCGCSSFITDAVITVNSGTVNIGIGSIVVTDYANIKLYSNLSTNNDNPFGEDNTITMTESNLGDGYKTEYEINSTSGEALTGIGIGLSIFRELTGLAGLAVLGGGTCNNSDCQTHLDNIESLAKEIGVIRTGIDNQLISDTNTVKDEKTEIELFIWSYKNTDATIQEDKDSTSNTMRVIENQNGFEY